MEKAYYLSSWYSEPKILDHIIIWKGAQLKDSCSIYILYQKAKQAPQSRNYKQEDHSSI